MLNCQDFLVNRVYYISYGLKIMQTFSAGYKQQDTAGMFISI